MKMFETDDPSAANPAYNLSYTRYYAGEYEKQVSANNTIEVCYINTPVTCKPVKNIIKIIFAKGV